MRFKIPWARLTRAGIPEMQVIRRPLRIDAERMLEVGEKYPVPEDPRAAVRCRQYYEARRIAPVPVAEVADKNSKKKEKNNGRSKK